MLCAVCACHGRSDEAMWNATAAVRSTVDPVDPAGRRLSGRWHAAVANAASAVAASAAAGENDSVSSTKVRITRGLGVFAGVDFPCDRDRDAFVGAPWARGACLIKCNSQPSGLGASHPRCAHAIAVCERLSPTCSTVDINVEGTVATLKQESPLSARTSRVKHVAVTHARGDRAAGKDGACAADAGRQALRLRALTGRGDTCILDCPKVSALRSCTRSQARVGKEHALKRRLSSLFCAPSVCCCVRAPRPHSSTAQQA